MVKVISSTLKENPVHNNRYQIISLRTSERRSISFSVMSNENEKNKLISEI